MNKKPSRTQVFVVMFMVLFAALVLWGYKVPDETRLEFNAYLSNKYPQLKFKMKSVQYDPFYKNIFAEVKVLDEDISFSVSKNMTTKLIHDNYEQIATNDFIRKETRRVFKGTAADKYVILMYQQEIPWLNTNGEHQTMMAFVLDLNCAMIKDEVELSKIVEEAIKAMTNKSYDVQTVCVMGDLSGKVFVLRITDKASSMTAEEIRKHIEY